MLAKVLIQLLLLFCQFYTGYSNVEKTIFIAPQIQSQSTKSHHIHSQLQPGPHIPIIDSVSPSLRTKLHSAFPHSPIIPDVPSTGWYHLANLKPGRRYEVRICWAATTPADFTLDTFTAEDVSEGARRVLEGDADDRITVSSQPEPVSELFLRIETKAGYFTMNKTLMDDGLVVDADISKLLCMLVLDRLTDCSPR